MTPFKAITYFLVVSLFTGATFEESPEAVYNQDPNIIFPYVKCPAGEFWGSALLSRSRSWYYEFRGIPYAERPQRFEPAVIAEPLPSLYDAREHKSVCAQTGGPMGVQGSENCLFLSVAYPHEDRCQCEKNPTSLPVLVNIHGGSFEHGAGSLYAGTYILDHCVVYVSINYRLGPFGFLATDDSVLPGNLGLKDQVVALKWIHTNIAAFRGNPNEVTLSGLSAGAASISHLVASPAAKGLFHRAICQSGVALNPWAIRRNPEEIAQALAKAMNCPTETTLEMRMCLASKSMGDIVANQGAPGKFISYAPVIEGPNATDPFQTQHPRKLFKSGEFNRVPMIVGCTEDEGLIWAGALLVLPAILVPLNENWNLRAPDVFYYDHWNVTKEERDEISENIRNFYFNGAEIGPEFRQNLTNLYSDTLFVQGTMETIELHCKFAPVFPYVMSYKGLSGAVSMGYLKPASQHSDDLQYLFPLVDYGCCSDTNTFARTISALWTSFASTGKPIDDLSNSKRWEPVKNGSAGNAKWYDLNVYPKTFFNYLDDRLQFWKAQKSYIRDMFY